MRRDQIVAQAKWEFNRLVNRQIETHKIAQWPDIIAYVLVLS